MLLLARTAAIFKIYSRLCLLCVWWLIGWHLLFERQCCTRAANRCSCAAEYTLNLLASSSDAAYYTMNANVRFERGSCRNIIDNPIKQSCALHHNKSSFARDFLVASFYWLSLFLTPTLPSLLQTHRLGHKILRHVPVIGNRYQHFADAEAAAAAAEE